MTNQDNKEQGILFHLEELRKTLLACFFSLFYCFIPIFFFSNKILNFFIEYLIRDTGIVFNYFSPTEVFLLQIKFTFILDILICFPYMAKKIWSFVLPALYENEKKIILNAVISSCLFFLFGVIFCITMFLPLVVKFGVSFMSDNIQAVFGISNVLNLSFWLMLSFGIMFQFPIIVYYLLKSKIIDIATVKEKRPYVIVSLLLFAAILTPPDIISQLILFLPSYLLFEFGLIFSKFKIK